MSWARLSSYTSLTRGGEDERRMKLEGLQQDVAMGTRDQNQTLSWRSSPGQAVTQARVAAASRAAVGCHLDLRDATGEATQEEPHLGATSQGGASPAAGPTLQNLGKAPKLINRFIPINRFIGIAGTVPRVYSPSGFEGLSLLG